MVEQLLDELISAQEAISSIAAHVALPPSPNESLVNMTTPAEAYKDTADVEINDAAPVEAGKLDSAVDAASPPRSPSVVAVAKPMSPEKRALAAMFESIKMPPPMSPSKSSRTALASLSLSPSKSASGMAPTVPGRMLPSGAHLSSPSIGTSKPSSWDTNFSRSGQQSSPAVGTASAQRNARRHMSTPVLPDSSPSVRLSDLSLTFDNNATGTQELLVNDTLGNDSFLAGAAAADVTIDDSFDVSRAKAKFRVRAPVSRGGRLGKTRVSMVPEEEAVVAKKTSVDLAALGVGRVVKNAAGDETIELNITSSSFLGNVSKNLMDESGEASLLYGNSFSNIQSKICKNQRAKGDADSSSGTDDDEDANVKRWASKVQVRRIEVPETPNRMRQKSVQGANASPASSMKSPTSAGTVVIKDSPRAITTTPITRRTLSTSGPRRSLLPSATNVASTARTNSVPLNPVRSVARPSVAGSDSITPGASRLLRPRTSISGLRTPAAASALSNCSAAPVAIGAKGTGEDTAGAGIPPEMRTPMRSQRKSTFTTSRPPVSGPARRRESLLASQPVTPGRASSSSSVGARIAPTATLSPLSSTKTPSAPVRTITRSRPPLPSGVITPKASTSAMKSAAEPGSETRNVSTVRPRASLAAGRRSQVDPTTGSAASQRPSIRSTVSSSPSRTPVATPRARATPLVASAASSVRAAPQATMTKSASQPQDLAMPRSATSTVRASRIGAPRASMSSVTKPSGTVPIRIGTSARGSLITPRRGVTTTMPTRVLGESNKTNSGDSVSSGACGTADDGIKIARPRGSFAGLATALPMRSIGSAQAASEVDPVQSVKQGAVGSGTGFGYRPRPSLFHAARQNHGSE